MPYRKAQWEDAERVLGRKVPFSIIPREASAFDVYIPQWDEIIHIRPEATMPYWEQKKRKIMRYNRIVNSHQPMWARRVAEIMTFMDDVEDTLITMAAIARLFAWKWPKYIKGPTGLLFLAADILNVFQIWRFFMPGGATGKRAWESLEDLNPFNARSKLSRERRILRRMPVFGEWIEILQTTDNAFGVGICLGPILGFFQEFLFAGINDAKWIYNPGRQASAIAAASRMCAHAPAFLAMDVYSEEDYMKVLLAMAYCHSRLQWQFDHAGKDGVFSGKFENRVNNPALLNPITVEVLNEREPSVWTTMKFPFPGEPTEFSFEHITPELAEDITNNLKNYTKNASRGEFSLFMGASATVMIDSFIQSFTGPTGSLELIRRREGILMAKIIEAGVSPPTDAPFKEWEQFWNMNRGFFKKHRRNMTVKDYRKIAPHFPTYWIRTYRPFWGLFPETAEIIGENPTDEYIQNLQDFVKGLPAALADYEKAVHIGKDINILLEQQEEFFEQLLENEPESFMRELGWVVPEGEFPTLEELPVEFD